MKSILSATAALAATGAALAGVEEDRSTIARLDTEYQAAVERNDAAGMDAILHKDMVVVLGDGTVRTRKDLLDAARETRIVYERQVEDPGTQIVRFYGPDTAVVTALLWVKGTRKNGSSLDVRLWFSDTYVRTAQGWRYAFGQASLPVPGKSEKVQPGESG
ncbi:MAG: nuclear transport factor 2 family protein [Steroidobacteraceae bacterium]